MRALLVLLAALVAVCAPVARGAVKPGSAGQIVFRSNRDDGKPDLYLMNRDGSGVHRLTYLQSPIRTPAWSRDGTRIAFSANVDGNFDIYTVDADGSGLTHVTTDPAFEDNPRWTADGRIVFTRGGVACPWEVWITNADGTGQAKLPTGPGNATMADPAPSGTKVVFSNDRSGRFDLYTMQLDGTALKRIVTDTTSFGDLRPRWSPSGQDVVFWRDTFTDNDLYLVHANGQGLRRLTNTPTRAEESPSWSPSGDEIVFMGFFSDGSPGRLYSIRPDGTGDTQLSTAYSAPLVEDFGDGYRDGGLWHSISDPGGSILETGGRLVATIEADAVPGGQFDQVDEHWGSQCTLTGDYDFQVDYQLLDWSAFGGMFTALSAFFGNAGISRLSSVSSPPFNEQYTAWNDGGFAALNTTDTAGSFRLARVGGYVTAYYRTAGSAAWQALFSGPAPNPTVYGMGLTAPGSTFQHVLGRVAFDDFRLNSGALSCPDWWSEGFPDWGGQG
jgi:TolB protein